VNNKTIPPPAPPLPDHQIQAVIDDLGEHPVTAGVLFGNKIDPNSPDFHGALTEGERAYGKDSQQSKIFSAAALYVLALRYDTKPATH
jgi:hypothetical protein